MKNTYQLLHNRGQDAYKANKLMADKITTLEQHLDYEAIIQIAEIDDQDLLYLNFDNQALGESACWTRLARGLYMQADSSSRVNYVHYTVYNSQQAGPFDVVTCIASRQKVHSPETCSGVG